MKMLLTIFTLTLCLYQAQAQDSKEEMLESLRVAYITKQLELTPNEAEKFWPVYNKYQGDLRKMMLEHRDKKGTELELQEKMLAIRKQYRPEFTRCISEQKFDRLLRAERGWGDMLRKELQRRREMNDRPMNRPGAGRPGSRQ
jgi:hypothetical protein